MRMAYICSDRGISLDSAGGSSVHVTEMIRALAGRGVAVTVFTPNPPSRSDFPCDVVDLAGDVALNELRVRTAKALRESGRDPLRASEMYGLLVNQTTFAALTRLPVPVDVVYERQSLWSIAGLQYARLAGIPYLVEVNAPLIDQQLEYRDLEFVEAARAIEQLVLSSADRVLATAAPLVEVAWRAGATRRNVRVVPCGVPTGFFGTTPMPRRAADEEFIVGFVGTLKPWHGVQALLEAFAELHRGFSGYRLLVVGDGPMRGEVETFCRDHGLESVVTLAGSVPHARIPEQLARMDVGVAPYPPLDSFYFSPLKVWEYAAAGVPIVASEVGDLPTLFPHKEAALLHRPGSVGKIVRHVERLRLDPTLGPRLARRARIVARRYTWDRIAARVIRIADELARKKR